MNDRLMNKYIPMTETAYYILLSLREEKHGYGIIQHVGLITGKRLIIGPGTIYGTLSKMEKDGLIVALREENRRKVYKIAETGKVILEVEIDRLRELVDNY